MTSKYKMSFSERLKLISDQKNKEDKIRIIKTLVDNKFIEVMDLYLDPEIEFLDNDPVNYIPSTEPKEYLNVRLEQESKNLKLFTNKTIHPNITKSKRLALYKEILESIHPEDAILIEKLRKEKTLPYRLKPSYFTEALPFVENWKRG